MSLQITPLVGMPLIQRGNDLAELILNSLETTGISIQDDDILVLAQKIVSKAEGRTINLNDVEPSQKAQELSEQTGKDARLAELILRESSEILRTRPNTVVVEHRLGFVCANAGIDQSNVESKLGEQNVLLLPEDPDRSARLIRESIQSIKNKKIGVMIIDSHGRAWRNGTVGACIGLSGLPGLVDERGWNDLFEYKLKITVVAVADELASAASLMMGQAAEGTPVVHVRGFPYPLGEGSLKELIRPREMDMFR